MFFKLFKKDINYYQQRGDRFFEDEHFAEARHEYGEALQRLEGNGVETESRRLYLDERLQSAGDHLARLNLGEAEHALQRGDVPKAIEHIELSLDLSQNETIQADAKRMLSRLAVEEPHHPAVAPAHACSGCVTAHHGADDSIDTSSEFLSIQERFELLVQPLPGPLPERYRQMGEKFAYAYTAVHDGRVDEGAGIFRELAAATESDILDYEIALINFQAGRLQECESLLRRALTLNQNNPLCHLSLVQLMVETGREREAVTMLEGMISGGHLPEQSTLMLGDILILLGEIDAAMERYLQALNLPSVAREAAQKIVPLFEELGRHADAKAIAKQYLKGCC